MDVAAIPPDMRAQRIPDAGVTFRFTGGAENARNRVAVEDYFVDRISVPCRAFRSAVSAHAAQSETLRERVDASPDPGAGCLPLAPHRRLDRR